MAESSIDAMLLYGNAWQGDYLRYGADFGILEGHGFALVSSAGPAELFLDSVVEAERAEVETSGAKVHFDPDVVRIVAARVDAAGVRLAAAPLHLLPSGLLANCDEPLADATALVDRLLMHKLPAEIAILRRAAQLADDAYASRLTCAGAAVQTTS